MKFNPNNPFFSVIVICYNSELTIERCINSILSQTYKYLDIICINDGSTDNTLKLLEKFASCDNRVKVFSQKNKGRGVARNIGIQHSNGQFISFVDSDDHLDKKFLLHAHKTIQVNKSDLILYDIKYKKELLSESKNKIINDKFYIEEKVFCFYRSQSVISSVFSRNLFTNNKIYFPLNKSFEDFFVLHKLINRSTNPLISQQKLYNYTPTDNSVTNILLDDDLSNIFESLYDFNNFINSNNLDKNIFSERFNNIFKFIILKFEQNNNLNDSNSIKILNQLIHLGNRFSISNESLYYNIYLILRNNNCILDIINNEEILSPRIISFFNSIIADNKKVISSVIDYLIEERIDSVSVIGIGYALLEAVQLLRQNNISIISIFTDLYLNQALDGIPLFSINELHNLSSSYTVVGSYISAKKYTKLISKNCIQETRALNFYNVLED